MKQSILLFSIIAALLLIPCVRANGANLAFDSAADSVYDDGWQAGDNGGFGWAGGWNFFGVGPFFTASSTTNGFGDPANDGDIDIQGRSWGTYTFVPINNIHENRASRPFAGALDIGQSFSMRMDNGFGGTDILGFTGFDLGSDFGYAFRLSAQINTNAGTYYAVVDGAGATLLPIGITDQGLQVVFTLTSSTSYTLSLSGIGTDAPADLPYVFNGTLDPLAGADITLFSFFSKNTGSGPANWNFINSIAIIPEPSAFALVGIALVLALLHRRKQRYHM